MPDKNYKQFLFPGGIIVLVIGVWMILAWWGDVVSFFKGFLGIAVAVGGLLMMYTKKVQSDRVEIGEPEEQEN